MSLSRETQLNILKNVVATGILPEKTGCDILAGENHTGISVQLTDGFDATDRNLRRTALEIAMTVKNIQPTVKAVTTSFMLDGPHQTYGRGRDVTVSDPQITKASVNYEEVLQSLQINPDVLALESAVEQSNALPKEASFYVVQLGHEASVQIFPGQNYVIDVSFKNSAFALATAIFEKDETITEVRIVCRQARSKYVTVSRSAFNNSKDGGVGREKLVDTLEINDIRAHHMF